MKLPPDDRKQSGGFAPCLAWTLIAACVFLFFFATGFESIGPTIDGCTYASAARSIVRGEGALPGWVSPINFVWVKAGKYEEAADRMQPLANPIWPLVLALFFKLFSPTDAIAALTAGLFFVLTTPFVFLIARKLFSLRAGHLAAALYALCAPLLAFTLQVLTEPLFVFALAGTLWFALARKGPAGGLVLGFFFALAVLSKSTGILWAAPLLILAVPDREGRWLRLGALLIGAALFFSVDHFALSKAYEKSLDVPLRARSESTQPLAPEIPAPPAFSNRDKGLFERIVDGPLRYIVLLHSHRFPDHSYSRGMIQPETSTVVRQDMNLFVERAKINLGLALSGWTFRMAGPLLCILFWVAVVWVFVRKEIRLFAIAALLSMALSIAPHIVTFAWVRYQRPGLLFYLILIAGFLDALLERFPSQSVRRVMTPAIVIACSFPLGFTAGIDFLRPISDENCLAAAVGDSEYFETLGRLVQNNVAKNQTVVCDVQSFPAWYGDRHAVWLPNDMDTLNQLRSRVNLDYLLLTFQFHRPGYDDFWRDWIAKQQKDPAAAGDLQFITGSPTPRGAIYLFKIPTQYAQ
jgi:Dolichyl-phosphate-mannose-protein mannosyltransferase